MMMSNITTTPQQRPSSPAAVATTSSSSSSGTTTATVVGMSSSSYGNHNHHHHHVISTTGSTTTPSTSSSSSSMSKENARLIMRLCLLIVLSLYFLVMSNMRMMGQMTIIHQTTESSSSSSAVLLAPEDHNIDNNILLDAADSFHVDTATTTAGAQPREDNNNNNRTTTNDAARYIPSMIEDYVVRNADSKLGYTKTSITNMSSGCDIWTKKESSDIYDELHSYWNELKNYVKLQDAYNSKEGDGSSSSNNKKNHDGSGNAAVHFDIREELVDDDDIDIRMKKNRDVCSKLELTTTTTGSGSGLASLFPSKQLSYTDTAGYIEPLLPPLRDPAMCYSKRKHLMSLRYMIHDFPYMCRSLRRTSRTILIDMGASLQFHGGYHQPAMYLIDLYERFGFHFDHIYAYEITQTSPSKVFDLVPQRLLSSYHWINVGVSSDPKSHLNPLYTILSKYNKDDLIIVKLDIDTTSIEIPLAKQILHDPKYHTLIDSFYFEHHVYMKELASNWKKSMNATIADSLDLFYQLRKQGIPAHSWV